MEGGSCFTQFSLSWGLSVHHALSNKFFTVVQDSVKALLQSILLVGNLLLEAANPAEQSQAAVHHQLRMTLS
ncbi:hypothetical protein E2320_000345 [Naja naja]|nr:hypothetical protein E2320_000345 [Naja naja]